MTGDRRFVLELLQAAERYTQDQIARRADGVGTVYDFLFWIDTGSSLRFAIRRMRAMERDERRHEATIRRDRAERSRTVNAIDPHAEPLER